MVWFATECISMRRIGTPFDAALLHADALTGAVAVGAGRVAMDFDEQGVVDTDASPLASRPPPAG